MEGRCRMKVRIEDRGATGGEGRGAVAVEGGILLEVQLGDGGECRGAVEGDTLGGEGGGWRQG